MSDIDWEQIEQEDRLWPWLNDPSQEVIAEWSAYVEEE